MFTFGRRQALRASAAPAIIMAAMLAAPVLAQDGAGTPGTGASASDEAIVVTGSRIARRVADSPNPIAVISRDDITLSGDTNLTDVLTTIPSLQGSLTSYDTSGDRAGIGYTGLNLLNLRNLGFDRTLVLIDGRRHIAAVEGLQSVDINTIPRALVERVEVFTGGASAVYGADGVSGVVNFIQKKDFQGISIGGQTGISSRGDAAQRLLTLTAGHNFSGGRGNIAVAWEHSEEDRLSTQRRKRYRDAELVTFQLNPDDTEIGTQNNDGIPDRIPLRDIRYIDTSREGGIDVNFDGLPDFYGAQGLPFDPGRFIPDAFQQGGSGTRLADYRNDLLPQIRRDVVSALAHFEVSDALTLYAEGKYAKTKSYSVGQPTFDLFLFIPGDNPFIPAAVLPEINPFVGGVLVNRDNFDFGRSGEDIKRQTIRTVLGAKGQIASNLAYDVSYVYGRTKTTNRYVGDILTDRYYAAIDAVAGADGQPTCRVNVDPQWVPFQPFNPNRRSTDPTTFAPGSCIPLNLFGEGSGSQAAIDWIRADTTNRTRLTQHVISGALTGDTGGALELPGGPLSFAAGGEYRKESSSFVADPLAQQGLTYTNILGNTKGSFDVWELFAEVNAPILSGLPFAERLEASAAFRYSNYSTVGSTTAWKFGAQWAPIRDLTLRGSYSKAVRAPNISELFGARSQTFQPIEDPCSASFLQNGTQYRAANCQTLLSGLGVTDPANFVDTRTSTVPGFAGGNRNIREERAKTWTAGVVLAPSFAPRLLITADWYDIRIRSAINYATSQQVADLCVDQPTLENPYCGAITRISGGTQAGFISSFEISPLNVANFRTSGLDFAIDYQIPTEKMGDFAVRLVGSYLDTLSFVPIPGAGAVNQAYEPDAPKYRVTADFRWTKGRLTTNWQMNYASKVFRGTRQETASNPDIYAPEYLRIKQRFSHDVSVSYDVDDRFQIYGGVNNLFDQKPSIGALNTPISAVGRFLFVGAKVSLADLFGPGD